MDKRGTENHMTSDTPANDNRDREALSRYPLSLQITALALWGDKLSRDEPRRFEDGDKSDPPRSAAGLLAA